MKTNQARKADQPKQNANQKGRASAGTQNNGYRQTQASKAAEKSKMQQAQSASPKRQGSVKPQNTGQGHT